MEIKIFGEFIKLGQLLKKINVIDSGGESKDFIEKHSITVNGVEVKSRGFKVKPLDVVWIDDSVYYIKNQE